MTSRSRLLVAFQFIAFAYLVITEPLDITRERPYGVVLVFVGFAIGVWALWAMRASRFRVTPEVAHGAELVMHGPYAYVRHPMYSGLLVIVAGLLIHYFTLPRLVVAIALAVDLIVKANYEEKLLSSHFSEYREYQRQTHKLIPYIY